VWVCEEGEKKGEEEEEEGADEGDSEECVGEEVEKQECRKVESKEE
jgi:hypothetical protein